MRNFIFSFLALILLPAYMSGQVIKGKISDQEGMGVAGASIVVGNSNVVTYSDFDGAFNINAKVGEVLNIKLIGFESRSITATAEPMQIKMIATETKLKEVVVVSIGYGTRRKIDNTGAISQLNAGEITKTKVLNATQAI